MEIKDNSKDKKYFTIIPNYIANHSTANDQALYFQMKRLVGDEEGICFASEKYFKDRLGIGSKALKKSLQYLIDHKWIEESGYKETMTKGGLQRIKTYIVKDIWKMNMEYYSKGVSEREPLAESEGVSESNQRGAQKESKGVALEQQRRTIKNNIEEEQAKQSFAFASFWKEYPKKENKKKAEQIWKKKRSDKSLEEILDFIRKAKQTKRWQEGIIMHPTTFLNGERWNDDISSYGKPEDIKKKAYYQGHLVVEKNNKKYVIKDGEWLEFAGKEKDIIYK